MANTLNDGVRGCVIGGAVGDALGGPVEGLSSAQIRERHGGWLKGFTAVVASTAGTRMPPLRKGGGRVTDDTLLTVALSNVYVKLRRHLTAYDIADHFVSEIADKPFFVPDLESENFLAHRFFYAEKYLVLRLRYGNADPREAGVGNMVNCGAAIYMAPVGIVNAGDPEGAYREAIEIAGAHQSSYGREAAGVMAAVVAEALRPGASLDSVIEAGMGLARDGTRDAIASVVRTARECTGWEEAIPRVRDAVRPFDPVGDEYRRPGLDARRPSRTHSIEELPVALGMLAATKGEWLGTVLGSVNYGRDADSAASMAGAIAGALHGEAAIPREWAQQVSRSSKLELVEMADALSNVASEIFASDRRHWEERTGNFPPPDPR